MKVFKEVMNLREGFASNRQKDRIEVLSFSFGGSEKLAVLKQGQRIDILKETDKYREKDFGRKLKLINAYQSK